MENKEGKLIKAKRPKEKIKTDSLNIIGVCKKTCAHPVAKKVGIIISGVILLLVAIYAIFNLSYTQVIFPHTYVGDLNLGNKTLAQAKVILTQNIVQAESRELEVTYNNEVFKIKPTDIDLKYDLNKTLDLVWSTGRKGNLANISRQQVWAIFGTNRNQTVFTFSDEKLQVKIKELAQKIDQNEKDATIEITNLEPQVVAEKTGQKMNQIKTRSLILASFGNLQSKSSMDAVVEVIQPKILVAEATNRIEQTKKVLLNKIVLTGRDKTFTLESKDIAGLLEFTSSKDALSLNWSLNVGVSQEQIKKYLEGVAKDVNQEAKDAKFAIVNGKVSTFQAAQTGYELDQEKAIEALTDAILNSKDKVELKINEKKPEISDSSDANGIKELVGEGKTSWQGSAVNRIHNLTLGANNISGHIVKPGEEFSTIKALGPIDLESGFRKELVIKNSTEVVPEVGGGLCQVSTTLFRAAMNAGLKITARTNHSFRVSYYEPPVGMDATIYDPKPDFKFVNTMKTPILVWAVATDNGLTFQIYGTKDSRKVEVSTPVLFNYVSPGDTVYRETDTMETGAMRLVERATRGVTASFTYKVHDASGNVLEDDKFVSKYVPVPQTYLVGPGTEIPPVQ